MEYVILLVIMAGFIVLYLKKSNLNIDQNSLRIIELEKTLTGKEFSIKELEKERDILNIQIKSLDEVKTKKTELETENLELQAKVKSLEEAVAALQATNDKLTENMKKDDSSGYWFSRYF